MPPKPDETEETMMTTHPTDPLNADRPPGDPDCERCEGTGLDPDAYFVDEERKVWTHAPCSECLPEEEEATT